MYYHTLEGPGTAVGSQIPGPAFTSANYHFKGIFDILHRLKVSSVVWPAQIDLAYRIVGAVQGTRPCLTVGLRRKRALCRE